MSSIVIEEAQIKSHKKRVATSKLKQNKSRVRQVIENEIRKYFLICESCFWCASYCENFYHYYDSTRSQNIITKPASCPACSAENAVELFPISFDKPDKPSIGASFH